MLGISQIDLMHIICDGLQEAGITAINTRQMNAIIAAARDIAGALTKKHVPAANDMGLLAWLHCDETGLSSQHMAYVLAPLIGVGYVENRGERVLGEPISYPHDADDFGRCVGLLRAVPELRPHLGTLASGHGPYWAALIPAWDELEELYGHDKVAASKRIEEIFLQKVR